MASFVVGICDTTFARYDLARDVIEVLEQYSPRIKYVRYTVPGVKDLPAGCKILFSRHGVDACIALGMPGPKPIDKTCAHEASMGLIYLQVLEGKHVIEVFVHEDEADDPEILKKVCKNRAMEHAQNLVDLLLNPDKLTKNAGKGLRQGFEDVGPL